MLLFSFVFSLSVCEMKRNVRQNVVKRNETKQRALKKRTKQEPGDRKRYENETELSRAEQRE